MLKAHTKIPCYQVTKLNVSIHLLSYVFNGCINNFHPEEATGFHLLTWWMGGSASVAGG